MKWLQRTIVIGYTLMMAVILAIVLLVFDTMWFGGQKEFLMLQSRIVLAGLAGLALVCLLLGGLDSRIRPADKNARGWLAVELVFWAAIFIMQAVYCFHAYFMTGWDAGLVLYNAYMLAAYDVIPDFTYYSNYPNNIFITEIFAAVIRLFRALVGDPGVDRCAYVLIVLQCALNTCAGMLCRRVARWLTGSTAFSVAAAAVYIGFIGISPWMMIPYSDSMGLVFPIAILYLYQSQQGMRKPMLQWGGIVVLSVCGFLLKPQILIVTIAILILETARLLGERNARAWLCRVGGVTLLILMGLGPVKQAFFDRSAIEVDPEGSVGLGHYIMMGVNEETAGVYSQDDFLKSVSIKDREERTRMQLETAAQRIKEMGLKRLLIHLRLKTLVNYADGTFAWGIIGNFVEEELEDKDDVLSPWLKDMVYMDGSGFKGFATYLQCVWLGLLAGSLLCGVASRGLAERSGHILMAILLSIIGLTVFEWIFEARARYLYTYAPFYVLAGMSGLWYTMKAIGWALRRRGMPGST